MSSFFLFLIFLSFSLSHDPFTFSSSYSSLSFSRIHVLLLFYCILCCIFLSCSISSLSLIFSSPFSFFPHLISYIALYPLLLIPNLIFIFSLPSFPFISSSFHIPLPLYVFYSLICFGNHFFCFHFTSLILIL